LCGPTVESPDEAVASAAKPGIAGHLQSTEQE
jgi:hypothetical protein